MNSNKTVIREGIWNPVTRVTVICSCLFITFYLSYFFKSNFMGKIESSLPNETILKKIPTFQAFNIVDNGLIDRNFVKNLDVDKIVIHFWGTWCAPCEKEFPDIVNFAKELEKENIAFIFVAVNDKAKDIRKFLKKFPHLSNNIYIAYDVSGKSLTSFGTMKVPETFFFNRDLSSIRKFIGPQNWNNRFYKSLLTENN